VGPSIRGRNNVVGRRRWHGRKLKFKEIGPEKDNIALKIK
jgi:hypothetical protein